MAKRFYNCHAHSFTYDHVPKHFLGRGVAINWVLHRKWVKGVVRNTPVTGKFDWLGKILVGTLTTLMGLNRSQVIRYLNFIKYGDRRTQAEVIKSMQAYYPKNTGYVLLTMDMEFMGAGMPKTRFEHQLDELARLKTLKDDNGDLIWDNYIYPFVFCDPRRINPEHERELDIENHFIGKKYIAKLENYITNKIYQGIKLYPALGYFPFDKRMRIVYDFAVKNSVPLITHCTIGAVHFKYDLDEKEYHHPFLHKKLPKEKPFTFQQYFSHPLNYECVLNHDLLKKHWGKDAPDYSNLKICLGHWGTREEWHNFMNNAWLETSYRKMDSQWPSLELVNWHIGERTENNFSWFTIICDMMRKYPNVYADISFTLYDTTLLPLLKMILEADDKIRSRVLFGTDFYLVSKAVCERDFTINIRSFLGVDMFHQIAVTNAEMFLNNNFNQVKNEWWEDKNSIIVSDDNSSKDEESEALETD